MCRLSRGRNNWRDSDRCAHLVTHWSTKAEAEKLEINWSMWRSKHWSTWRLTRLPRRRPRHFTTHGPCGGQGTGSHARSHSTRGDPKTLGGTLVYVEFVALVDTLASTLAKANSETLGNTLGYVEAEVLIDTMADTLAEADDEALSVTLGYIQTKEWLTRFLTAYHQ